MIEVVDQTLSGDNLKGRQDQIEIPLWKNNPDEKTNINFNWSANRDCKLRNPVGT